jgi:hypothetical protein
MEKYRVSFWIEWGPHAYLWAADERTRDHFDVGPINSEIPMSDAIRKRAEDLADWFQSSLNWSNPSGPGPWRQEECDRFKHAVRAFYQDLVNDIGDRFDIIYSQEEPDEDPDLDEYERDPNNFKRKRKAD